MKRRIRALAFLTTVMVMMLMLVPSLYANEIRVEIDGEQVQFEVQPFIQDGRTMVPLRAIAEILDVDIDWDGEERSITYVNHDGATFRLHIDYTYVVRYGMGIPEEDLNPPEPELITLDVPPTIVDGRTFVPLRFIAESFGVDVDFVDGVVFLTTIAVVDMNQTVWVAVGGGDIYHSINDCGNTNPDRATYVTRQEAQDEGLRACLRCW